MNTATAVILGATVSSASALLTTVATSWVQLRINRSTARGAAATELRVRVARLMAAMDTAAIEASSPLAGARWAVGSRLPELLDRVSTASNELRMSAPPSVIALVDRHGDNLSQYLTNRDLDRLRALRDEMRVEMRAAVDAHIGSEARRWRP